MRTHVIRHASKSMTMLVPLALLIAAAWGPSLPPSAQPFPQVQAPSAYHGIASWYSQSDPRIRKRTASGENFNDAAATGASWYFPIGSHLKITNTQNGKSVICRVNDRGPRRSLKRAVDLSKSAFKQIAHPRL